MRCCGKAHVRVAQQHSLTTAAERRGGAGWFTHADHGSAWLARAQHVPVWCSTPTRRVVVIKHGGDVRHRSHESGDAQQALVGADLQAREQCTSAADALLVIEDHRALVVVLHVTHVRQVPAPAATGLADQ